MKFIAEDDQLTVQFQGLEKFWALKGKLAIPRAAIVNLDWQPQLTFTNRIWRLFGTDIPGVLWAGRFRGGGQNYFLYLQNPRGLSWTLTPKPLQNTLTITTQDYPYQQIVLTCQPDIGAGLLNWWQGTTV